MRDDYIDDGDDGRVEDTEWELDEAGTLEALSFSSVHPVQGNYVMSFHMTEREESALAQHAQAQLTSLLSECEYNSPGWRRVRGKKGSRVKLWEKGSASALTQTSTEHKRLRRIASPLDRPTWLASSAASSSSAPSMHAIYSVKSSITVKAPLESVLKTLDCSYATSYRSFTKLMYQNLVADTSVLFHNHQTPEMTESLAVRWLVTRCQNPLVSDCDFCLVDYTKVHSIDELSAVVGGYQGNNHNEGNNDASTRAHDGLRDCEALPVAYKILRSIDTKFCPELSSSHHLVRGAVPLGEGASLSPSTKTVASVPPTMTHYLKVMGGKKLMKVASNMKCCEPVLHLLRPVVTRNTLTCRIEGYAFADLPLVKGPQQVRFYAGIPLVDSKERLLGALVVCDSKFVEEEEELMECTELLESVARAIVNRIEERHEKNILKSFMDTPLVRQSEPVASSSRRHNVPVEGEEGDEETVRTVPLSLPDTSRMALHSPKAHSVEYYKRQMLRLVEQANETQDQVMQTITHIQEVSY
ncbi:hypothetical protein Poli38472_005519 [Pythium oligandrum]|uniref:GAF domain-containing protein n=1 Tax=Pythium oligandrum TaxID=41045 RepID=A0A8K1CG55_PYTOL|nr:hypothetical protein Poli38472_005519 [Pythium oligandrum]|eukprot:TMW62901.1 hypothetical protein Poli38472_005519 [Pythium oligandrum]